LRLRRLPSRVKKKSDFALCTHYTSAPALSTPALPWEEFPGGEEEFSATSFDTIEKRMAVSIWSSVVLEDFIRTRFVSAGHEHSHSTNAQIDALITTFGFCENSHCTPV
jgi:hypothetical protein